MGRLFIIFLISVIINPAFVWAANASIPRSMRTFEKIMAKEPSFAQIMKRYFKMEGVTNYHFPKWEKKIKIAPLLPTLYFGYDHAFKESQDFDIKDNISISSGEITVGPKDNDYGFNSNLGQTIRARAVWKLDELVFNRNYFILHREKRDLAKARADLSQRVYKVYEQRYLLLLKYFQLRQSSPRKASLFYSKYLVLTDRLDAMTGGAFRKRWWRR